MAIANSTSMRVITLFTAATLLAGSSAHAEAAEKSAQDHPYKRQYLKTTFGKRGLAGVGANAAIGQARNRPREWGRGASGFGKRLASGMATHVVRNSIEYGVAAARHEDLHYRKANETGFGPRLKHALVSTVVTEKTTTGQKTVAAGRISGAFGSGLISRAWQPAAYHTLASGLTTGGISLGAEAAVNVAREFWPRKPRGMQRR